MKKDPFGSHWIAMEVEFTCFEQIVPSIYKISRCGKNVFQRARTQLKFEHMMP